jgi:subtilisin family serine protease
MKSSLLFVLVCLMCCSCQKTEIQKQENLNVPKPYSAIQLNKKIFFDLNQYGSFSWRNQSVDFIWSALNHSDHMVAVGFQLEGTTLKEDSLHMVNINQPEWQACKSKLIQLILHAEQAVHPSLTLESLMPWKEEVLPVINVYIREYKTLAMLKSLAQVRYVEPMGYEPNSVWGANKIDTLINEAVLSESGCGNNDANWSLQASSDYFSISPWSKQSWHLGIHGIPSAWQRSAGKGIKIFMIDTGVQDGQDNFGLGFNQGYSLNRTIEKKVTLPRASFLGIPTGPVETVNDLCGHGTSMAGVCVAPRGTDGAACGVAYQSDLIMCRSSSDVFIDESRESKGVADAFTTAANRTDVKIISMSLGRITSSSQIKDAVLYAYGKGKLIFCAAGTSFSWTSGWVGVIFPANLDQVNAVTGVSIVNSNVSCSSCHDGSEVDFTIAMEKNTGASHPISLADQGDWPSTVGGSSVATATAAGIAALVWAKYPTWTAAMVQSRLILCAGNYPIKNNQLGWGIINAEKATR